MIGFTQGGYKSHRVITKGRVRRLKTLLEPALLALESWFPSDGFSAL